ncbi:MAG: DUF4838 domain-containing protein [Pirellulales bacterium]|nr:DUF4838 domain-containing protein [Pirellulales bacterium]
MKRILFCTGLLFYLCSASATGARHETLGHGAAGENPRFVIIDDGKSLATIVIPQAADGREHFAAVDLQRVIKKMSGASLPIKRESEPVEGRRIQIGRTRFNLAQDELKGLKPEGFVIKIAGDDLCLVGRDAAGTEFAVYTFLQRYCDVGWFWPGESGEVVPRQRTVAFGRICDIEEPDFLLRKITVKPRQHMPADNYHLVEKQDAEPAPLETRLWRKRNRLGGSVDYAGTHTFGKMVPPAKYGPTHPEYFALVNGKRKWQNFNGKHGCQLCTTHPDVIDLGIRWTRKFLDDHPDISCVTIAPNDGGGFCQCPRCRALDKAAGSPKDVISDRMFTFANQIAAGIEKTHPDRAVLMLAYSQYLQPPLKVKPRENVWVQLCIFCDRFWSGKKKRQGYERLDNWANIADNLAIYEYYVWRGSADMPRSYLALVEESIRRFHTRGSRLFYTQSQDNFGTSGMMYYVAARLLWDVNTRADDVLDEYCRKCFGNAAEPMRKWFRLFDDRWRYAVETCGYGLYGGSPAYWLAMFPPDILAEARRHIEAAKRSAGQDAIARVEFFEKEMKYTELTLAALRELQALESAGIVDLQDDYPTRFKGTGNFIEIDISSEKSEKSSKNKAKPASKLKMQRADARKMIARALEAWDARNAWVEKIRGRHIIDYWHVKEDADRDYRHDPSDDLRQLLAKFPADEKSPRD